MEIASFLSQLRSQDIHLQLDGERLKVNAPKGALTAPLRENIQQHKADIIHFYRSQASALTEIPHVSRDIPVACSFAQQRLWLLDRLETSSHAYNIPLFFRTLGELKIPVLQAAVNEIIRRHESLRTVFREPEGDIREPRQFVLPDLTLDMPVTDLGHLPPAEIETSIQEQARRQVEKPFDLAQGPLFRLSILRVTDQDHVLLFMVHHIVFDGLSLDIFLKELGVLYTTFLRNQPISLQNLDIQYSDYSVWQRNRLTGKNLEEHLDFWRNALQDAPSVLSLPTDHPRPAIQSYTGARRSFSVAAETALKFKILSQENGATPFMAFHAVLAILLTRYTGKTDIVMGTPIANRNHRQLESLIGFFANTLVLRSEVSLDKSFNALLAQIKSQVLQAYKYQELPFEKLVDELKIERSMSYNPVFQVLFSFQNAHTEGFTLPGVEVQPLAFASTVSKFDLSFIVREHRDRFSVILEYNTDLFETSTIERMMGHFKIMLNAITDNPEQTISNLPLLTKAEIQQLQTWNDTATDYPKDQTIIGLFEQQVEKTPNNIALIFEKQQLSYQNLNQKVNQLAHYLLSKTGPDKQTLPTRNGLIAIAVERSPDMVIGLLAILKAGGAYVPIDPNYPAARARYMLEDSATPVLLTQSHLKTQLPWDELRHDCVTVCLDEVDISEQSIENPAVNCQADDLAYVIYTSGSTGQPKGTLLTHKGLSNYLQWAVRYYDVAHGNGAPVQSSIAFDATITSVYLPLIAGKSTVLLPEHEGIEALATILQQKSQFSLVKITPAHLEILNQQLNPINYARTSHALVIGGEVLTSVQIKPWLHYAPDTHLLNEYGPTEAVVGCCVYNATGQTTFNGAIPIGLPIANTRIYILNKNNQLQPLGIPGELCIAGNGLAHGYLNRPELTAKQFIEVKLFDKTERIYKTGDLARWLPDGNLEFLGRIDDQVKVHGFRIEPGEIEVVLLQHPDVKESVVIVQETTNGNKQLVAYVQMDKQNKEQTKTSFELKTYLKEILPDYMVPTFFVVVDTFPLSPNGKINRKALPEPNRQNVQGTGYMHPRNALELSLSQIWENILNVSPISVFDNFFELGGDSLLAIQLISDVNKKFEVRIPQHALFQNGTIEQLACILPCTTQATITFSPLVGLQTQGNKAPIFCIHAAGGIVFRYIPVANLMSSHYDHPFYGLQAPGIEPGEIPYDSIEDMAQNYVQAIRQEKPEGPYLLVGWSMGGSVAFEMARLLENAGGTVTGVIMIDAPSPFIDSYEEDDIEFLLERLQPAVGLKIEDELHKQHSDQAKKLYILEQKKLLGLLAPDIELSEAEQRLRLHKHHNQLLCQYRPEGLIKAKIAFIKASEATPFDKKMKDPIPAWAEFTHQGIVEHESPGNHFNMFSNEHSPILADNLHACIQDLEI